MPQNAPSAVPARRGDFIATKRAGKVLLSRLCSVVNVAIASTVLIVALARIALARLVDRLVRKVDSETCAVGLEGDRRFELVSPARSVPLSRKP